MEEWFYNILFIVVPVFQILGFLVASDAIMHGRTAQGTIAWVLALSIFPYVTVILYLMVGHRRFYDYVETRRAADQQISHLREKIIKEPTKLKLSDLHEGNPLLLLNKIAITQRTGGNKTTLLIDGNATFNSILEGIRNAEKFILVQFFIVHSDELGMRLQKALIDAAGRGVKIYFLVDAIGSVKLPNSYLKKMRRSNIQAECFQTGRGILKKFRINFRNHRKIVVVDGTRCWVGGHNVGNEYLGKDPKFGHWRDTHVMIQGPAALPVQVSFVEDWYWTTGKVPEIDWPINQELPGDHELYILATGPADDKPEERCSLFFLECINRAQNRVWISSPYFVPDIAVVKALQLAVLRGVDVRILLPQKPDHKLVYLAGYSYLPETVGVGVKAYQYTDGFLHQKAILVDDKLAGIGTANLDNRSFRINFEITAINTSMDFISQVDEMFERDFKNSLQLSMDDYNNKGFIFLLASRFSRLMSPML